MGSEWSNLRMVLGFFYPSMVCKEMTFSIQKKVGWPVKEDISMQKKVEKRGK